MALKNSASKRNKDTLAHPSSEGPAPLLDDERIALRAYERWLARGCPVGDDLRDWLEAEQELRREAAAELGGVRSSKTR